MTCAGRNQRGLSPVVGGALLITIVVLLVAVCGYLFLGLTDETDPSPNVHLTVETSEDGVTHQLAHENGATLDGDRLALKGAADTDGLAGKTLTAGSRAEFYPVDDEVVVVWTGDHDTAYVLGRFDAEWTLPVPDEKCDWVEDETNGGTDSIKVDGIVVNCDVETTEGIEVQNGGTVIGETASSANDLDGDNAMIYGDADVEKVLNLQDGTITGSATSRTADVKLGNATVKGDVTAEKVVEVGDGSSVDGDARSVTKDVKVLSSTVSGSVTGGNIVKLQDATIEGDVYIDEVDFDCTNSTINGQSCGEYTPKDPGGW